jgi:hypothetical protein
MVPEIEQSSWQELGYRRPVRSPGALLPAKFAMVITPASTSPALPGDGNAAEIAARVASRAPACSVNVRSVLTIFDGGSYESGVSSLDTACGGPRLVGVSCGRMYSSPDGQRATCWAPVPGSDPM